MVLNRLCHVLRYIQLKKYIQLYTPLIKKELINILTQLLNEFCIKNQFDIQGHNLILIIPERGNSTIIKPSA